MHCEHGLQSAVQCKTAYGLHDPELQQTCQGRAFCRSPKACSHESSFLFYCFIQNLWLEFFWCQKLRMYLLHFNITTIVHRSGKADSLERELAVRAEAAAASVYSTYSFLLSKGGVSCSWSFWSWIIQSLFLAFFFQLSFARNILRLTTLVSFLD